MASNSLLAKDSVQVDALDRNDKQSDLVQRGVFRLKLVYSVSFYVPFGKKLWNSLKHVKTTHLATLL